MGLVRTFATVLRFSKETVCFFDFAATRKMPVFQKKLTVFKGTRSIAIDRPLVSVIGSNSEVAYFLNPNKDNPNG